MNFLTAGEHVKEKILIARRDIRILRFYIAAVIIFAVGNLFLFGVIYVPNFTMSGIDVGYVLALTTSLLFPLIIIILAEILRNEINYFITDSRIIKKSGLFKQNIKSIQIKTITQIETNQTKLQRLLSLGDISIINSNSTDIFVLKNVPNYKYIENVIYKSMKSKTSQSL